MSAPVQLISITGWIMITFLLERLKLFVHLEKRKLLFGKWGIQVDHRINSVESYDYVLKNFYLLCYICERFWQNEIIDSLSICRIVKRLGCSNCHERSRSFLNEKLRTKARLSLNKLRLLNRHRFEKYP